VNPVGLDPVHGIGWKFLIVYSVWILIEGTLVYFLWPETSGRTLEELAFCKLIPAPPPHPSLLSCLSPRAPPSYTLFSFSSFFPSHLNSTDMGIFIVFEGDDRARKTIEAVDHEIHQDVSGSDEKPAIQEVSTKDVV
jgi:hypothetical protein